MAVSENAVPGPDGRTWSVTTHRERRSLKASGQVPYLWAHVIVTTLMVVVFFFVLKSDAFMILSVMIAIVFIVWLVGFVELGVARDDQRRHRGTTPSTIVYGLWSSGESGIRASAR